MDHLASRLEVVRNTVDMFNKSLDDHHVKEALMYLSKYFKKSQTMRELRSDIDGELSVTNDNFLYHFEDLAKETEEIGQMMQELREKCNVLNV